MHCQVIDFYPRFLSVLEYGVGVTEYYIEEKVEVELIVDYDLCLVGKFLGERVNNFAGMEEHSSVLSLWRPIQGVSIEAIDDGSLYLFQLFI